MTLLKCLGYQWDDISSCVEWMAPFAFAMRGSSISPSRKTFTGVTKDDQHNIQCHSVELSILELAQQRQAYIVAEAEHNRQSPDLQQEYPIGYIEMTPPEENNSQIPVSDSSGYSGSPEENNRQIAVSDSSNNIRIGGGTYYYESDRTKQCEIERRDAQIKTVGRPNTTNVHLKVVQKPHQSSVFLSPTSDDSGLW